MNSRRLRRKRVEEENSSEEQETKTKRRASILEQDLSSASDSSSESEYSSELQEPKSVKKTKPKEIKKIVKKKVIDKENLHKENVCVTKYSTYKLGNFKNRSMKAFTKNLDIYKMKYMEISSRYSERPKKKICEFTGLPAMFTFPNSKLFFYDSSVYEHLKSLSSDLITFIYGTKEMCKNYDPFKNQY